MATHGLLASPCLPQNFRSKAVDNNCKLEDDDYDDDDDVYLYGNMVTESVATWKIPAEKVELVQRLPNAKGRFADIYDATLRVKNGKQKVVAKRLKRKLCCEWLCKNVSRMCCLNVNLGLRTIRRHGSGV